MMYCYDAMNPAHSDLKTTLYESLGRRPRTVPEIREHVPLASLSSETYIYTVLRRMRMSRRLWGYDELQSGKNKKGLLCYWRGKR